jgi:serine/threonine-protein kinase
MTTCIEDAVLLEIVEGERTLDASLQRHLATCTDCRLVLASAARGAALQNAESTEHDAPASEPSWDELGAGVVVGGRYTLSHFVGAGGMGVVWAARRVDDNVQIALKIARTNDAETERRIDREARVLAALDHPNILRILEVLPATPERGTVLVLPLLEGESLGTRLDRDGTMSLRDAARVVVPVAHALRAAHARGIVHRDLKPQNVFLGHDSRVTILDFGIAKLTPSWGTHVQLTRTGAAVGTPRYMAPEQLSGERDVDARADVWALGAVLFRVLSGAHAVRGDTPGAILGNLGHVAPVALSGFPPAVTDLVQRALVVSRDERLNDVGEFARVLSPYWA